MRYGLIGGLVALLGAGLFTFAQTVHADEIKVMASAAVKETYLELIPQFEQATGHKVLTIWSGTADMMKRLKGGETVDLVIIGANSLDELVKLGKVEPGSRVDFVKSGVGVAVRAGARKPDISSGDAVKQALLSASSIGYSSGPSGVYLDGSLSAHGHRGPTQVEIEATPIRCVSGRNGCSRGSRDWVPAGQRTHSCQRHRLSRAAAAGIQQITVFSTGIHTGATKPDAARALVRFLTSPSAAIVIRKNGMQPG